MPKDIFQRFTRNGQSVSRYGSLKSRRRLPGNLAGYAMRRLYRSSSACPVPVQPDMVTKWNPVEKTGDKGVGNAKIIELGMSSFIKITCKKRCFYIFCLPSCGYTTLTTSGTIVLTAKLSKIVFGPFDSLQFLSPSQSYSTMPHPFTGAFCNANIVL